MEILYTFSLLIIALSAMSRPANIDRGLAFAWGALFALAAFFRLLIECWPAHGPSIGLYATVILAAGCLSFLGPRLRFHRHGWFMAIPWMLAIVLLWVRSYFPQCDVDSLEYHLVFVRWLQDRAHLSEIQRHAEMITNWLYGTGFEEFLSIPGLAGDLPLCGGLVAGVLKILTLLTIVLLLPARATFWRYVASFLLLIDDHFFFSAQSRYVYLNLSMIPLIPLTLWLAWRGWRGNSDRSWLALAMALGLFSAKYYGVFLLPVAGGAFLYRLSQGLNRPRKETLFILLASIALAATVFGFHYASTGVWMPPRGLAENPAFFRGTEGVDRYILSGGFLAAFAHPVRRLVFSGNIALKMTAVLIGPTLMLWFWVRRLNGNKRIFSLRWLEWSALCFIGAQLWAFIAYSLYPIESRYPRYAMGLAILGVASLVLSSRRCLMRMAGTWQGIIRRWSGLTEWGVGCILFAFIVLTLDTRYYNVGPSYRPHWRSIVQCAEWKWQGHRSLDANAPYLRPILHDYAADNVPALEQCLQQIDKQSGTQLGTGAQLLIGAPYQNWPGALLANNAVLSGLVAGGGYLRFSGGAADLIRQDIRYAIVPKSLPSNGRLGPYVRRGVWGALEGVSFEDKAICESQDMKVVRLMEK